MSGPRPTRRRGRVRPVVVAPAEARRDIEARAAWAAVSAALGALGRVFMCADSQFRVLHASHIKLKMDQWDVTVGYSMKF